MHVAEHEAEIIAVVLRVESVEAEIQLRVLAFPEPAGVGHFAALGAVREQHGGIFRVDLDGGGVAVLLLVPIWGESWRKMETHLMWVPLRLARKPVTVALVTTCFGLGTGEARAEELKRAMAPRRVENCILCVCVIV